MRQAVDVQGEVKDVHVDCFKQPVLARVVEMDLLPKLSLASIYKRSGDDNET